MVKFERRVGFWALAAKARKDQIVCVVCGLPLSREAEAARVRVVEGDFFAGPTEEIPDEDDLGVWSVDAACYERMTPTQREMARKL